ncbi:hypothetical protein ACTWP5_27200 [Streptomyces sp. 4N509B]|uniref:hypothetical protein n=1 Tax=Streptomyces sp. 4N509B TaxID=3457413 RepID=UPI003FD488EC
MQPYEPSRPQLSYRHGQAPTGTDIPGMRAPHDRPVASSTPIYDSLYAEYRRMFRALPGDRSGEEELRFSGFGVPRVTYAATVGGIGGWRAHVRQPGVIRSGGVWQAVPPSHHPLGGYGAHTAHTAHTSLYAPQAGGPPQAGYPDHGRALPAALPAGRRDAPGAGPHEGTPEGP